MYKRMIYYSVFLILCLSYLLTACPEATTTVDDKDYASSRLPDEFETDNPESLRTGGDTSANIVSANVTLPDGTSSVGYEELKDTLKKVQDEIFWTDQMVGLVRAFTETEYNQAISTGITKHQDGTPIPGINPFDVDTWTFDYTVNWTPNVAATEDLVIITFQRQIPDAMTNPDATIMITFDNTNLKVGTLVFEEGPWTGTIINSNLNKVILEFKLLNASLQFNKYSRLFETISPTMEYQRHFQTVNIFQDTSYTNKGTKVVMLGNRRRVKGSERDLYSYKMAGFADQTGGSVIFEEDIENYDTALTDLFFKHQLKERFGPMGEFLGVYEYKPLMREWRDVAAPLTPIPTQPIFDNFIRFEDLYFMADNLPFNLVKDLYGFPNAVSKMTVTVNKPIGANVGRFALFFMQGDNTTPNAAPMTRLLPTGLNAALRNSGIPYHATSDGFLDATTPVRQMTFFYELTGPMKSILFGYWDEIGVGTDMYQLNGLDPANAQLYFEIPVDHSIGNQNKVIDATSWHP